MYVCIHICVYIYAFVHSLPLSPSRSLSLSSTRTHTHTHTHTNTSAWIYVHVHICIRNGYLRNTLCLSRTHTNAHTHTSPPFPHMWVSPPIHWVGDIGTTRMSSWCWFFDMKITEVSLWYIDQADHSYVHYLDEFVTHGWVRDVDFLIWRSLKWVRYM